MRRSPSIYAARKLRANRRSITGRVFSYYDETLSCGANATYIRSGQERVGRPLSAAESEALDAFYAIAEEHVLSMDLEPGDLQLLDSYVTLHDRSAYEDHPEPERKRHMLRLWLETGDRRPLAPDFGTYDFATNRVVGIRRWEVGSTQA